MNKDLHRLIVESRQLLSVASPQQKLRLLQLIKQSMRSLAESKNTKSKQSSLPKNSDYLEEK